MVQKWYKNVYMKKIKNTNKQKNTIKFPTYSLCLHQKANPNHTLEKINSL